MNPLHKTVYFGDKSFHFVSKSEYDPAEFDGIATHVWTAADGTLSPANIVKFFGKYDALVYCVGDGCDSIDAEFFLWSSAFKRVFAAGGIVANSHGEVVMIRRNDRWDLPKGHIEAGESAEMCAVREIAEETGVQGAKIATFLCNTMHAYDVYGVWELKTTHWYLLSTDGDCDLTPQASEGIERAEWCDAPMAERNLLNTYPTIRRVFDKYEEIKDKIW